MQKRNSIFRAPRQKPSYTWKQYAISIDLGYEAYRSLMRRKLNDEIANSWIGGKPLGAA